MPGPPVTIGAVVVVTPGATGAPDSGAIVFSPPPYVPAGGMPLATAGSLCQMVNSVTGIPYPLVIGPLASSGVRIGGQALVGLRDRNPPPPRVLANLRPPAAPHLA